VVLLIVTKINILYYVRSS